MKERIVEYFSRFMPLSEEDANTITEDICIQTFPKGSYLLKEGNVSTECYFVLKGCVRQFHNVDGEEKTTNFFTEEQWVISLHSFIQKTPADHSLICNEECILVIGNEKKENEIYAKDRKFETMSRMVLEKVICEQQELHATYITDTPELRYIKLLASRPDLLQRVPQYQLASYIGVKPESLSRIRKRMTMKDAPVSEQP